MKKVRIKMTVRNFAIMVKLLDSISMEDITAMDLIIQQSYYASIREARDLFWQTMLKHLEYREKVVSKQIPESSALLLFAAYYGVSFEGYENVAVKELCNQIEKQLFVSGRYELPVEVKTNV